MSTYKSLKFRRFPARRRYFHLKFPVENLPPPSRARACRFAVSKLFLVSTAATRLTPASLPLSENSPEGRARGALLKVNSTNEDGPTSVWGLFLVVVMLWESCSKRVFMLVTRSMQANLKTAPNKPHFGELTCLLLVA